MLASREELLQFALRDIRDGARREDVVEMLTKNGMPADEATALVNHLMGEKRAVAWGGAVAGLAIGGLLVVLGLGATVASGGHTLYYGAMVSGVFIAGRGLFRALG